MINEEDVKHIAELARLGLSDKEIKGFAKDLALVLGHFDTLKEVDISKVEPTFHPAESFLKKDSGVMRRDKAESQSEETVEDLIEAVPEKKGRHVKVKKILS